MSFFKNLKTCFVFSLSMGCYFSSFAQIQVNEIMASNNQVLSDDFGDFDDWVEIHNTGNQDIDLAGWYITDKASQSTQNQIPQGFSNQTTIPAGGYLLLWLDGQPSQGPLHIDAKLSVAGEFIGISNSNGSFVDSFSFGSQTTDISYGRINDGTTLGTLNMPSPRESNSGLATSTIAPPQSNVNSGFFDNNITINLSTSTNGADIHYTTNGSIPSLSDPVYNSNIVITNNTSLRAIAIHPTLGASTPSTWNYFINSAHRLPVICYTADSLDFYGPDGMFTLYDQDIELPVHVEMIEVDGTVAFSQMLEVELQGTGSAAAPKKALAMKAKSALGSNTIDYKVFPDLPYTQYRSLVTRPSGQDWNITYFRDGLVSGLYREFDDIRQTIEAPDLDLQGFRPVVVYINGQYYGLSNLRERLDWRYLKTHYDLDDTEVNLLENEFEVKEGSRVAFDALTAFVTDNDLSIGANYQYFSEKVDINSFIDYLILNLYVDNQDWPGNNFLHWKGNQPEDKWRWIIKDLDFTLGLFQQGGGWNNGDASPNSLDRLLTDGGLNFPNPSWSSLFFRKLMAQVDFKEPFLNRLADHMNVTFRPERFQDKIDTFRSAIAAEVPKDNQTWHGGFLQWDDNINIMRSFTTERPSYMKEHVLNAFPEIQQTVEVTLKISPIDGGTLHFNTISVDGFFKGDYFSDIPIPISATPRPGYRFLGWSIDTLENRNPSTLVLSENITLVAFFEAIPVQQVQIINFSAIGNKLNTALPFSVTANSSSGLPVSFSIVSGPASLSGNTMALTGQTGFVTVRATQAGDALWLPAAPVERTFEVIDNIIVPSDYCDSKGMQPWEEWIKNVRLKDINQSSAKNGYKYFAQASTALGQENNYTISITPAFSFNQYDAYISVWIDYNGDKDFNDAGENVAQSVRLASASNTIVTPVVLPFVVPASAKIGETRMRVSMKRGSFPTPCETFTYGEVEDYVIMIQENTMVSVITPICPANIQVVLPPAAFTVPVQWNLPTASTTCPQGTIQITQISGPVNGSALAEGLYIVSYQITDACGSSVSICTIRIIVKASSVPPPVVYCQAVGTTPWLQWIQRVQLSNLDNQSFKDSYGDYTNLIAQIEKSRSYLLSVTPKWSWTYYESTGTAWIDFNQDGDFEDPGEEVLSASFPAVGNGQDGLPLQGMISIPDHALIGKTRMRVSLRRGNAALPCGSFELGEVEDYSVEISSIATNVIDLSRDYIYLQAKQVGTATQLSWLQHSLTEVENYEIWHGTDRQHFQMIGSKPSLPDDDFRTLHTSQHNQPSYGVNYYYIKRQHSNGTTLLSPIEKVNIDLDFSEVIVFPIPAQNEVVLSLQSFEGQTANVSIIDAVGRVRERYINQLCLPNGNAINVSHLHNGWYTFYIEIVGRKPLARPFLIE